MIVHIEKARQSIYGCTYYRWGIVGRTIHKCNSVTGSIYTACNRFHRTSHVAVIVPALIICRRSKYQGVP